MSFLEKWTLQVLTLSTRVSQIQKYDGNYQSKAYRDRMMTELLKNEKYIED